MSQFIATVMLASLCASLALGQVITPVSSPNIAPSLAHYRSGGVRGLCTSARHASFAQGKFSWLNDKLSAQNWLTTNRQVMEQADIKNLLPLFNNLIHYQAIQHPEPQILRWIFHIANLEVDFYFSELWAKIHRPRHSISRRISEIEELYPVSLLQYWKDLKQQSKDSSLDLERKSLHSLERALQQNIEKNRSGKLVSGEGTIGKSIDGGLWKKFTNEIKIRKACSMMDCPEVVPALKSAMAIADLKQVGSVGVVAFSDFIPVFTDPSFLHPLLKLVRVMNELVTHVDSGQPINANFFDDLTNAFQGGDQSGPLADQEERMWKFIALYGSRGVNIRQFIGNLDESAGPALMAAQYIFVASHYIQTSLSVQGRNYLFPKEIETTCDFGKPYYFWMSAYIARQIQRKSPEVSLADAAMAAHLLNVGYQFSAKTPGRTPELAFSSGSFSDYNNFNRLPIAIGAAGAWYGARSLTNSKEKLPRTMNLDLAIQKTFNESTSITPQSAKEASSSMSLTNIESSFILWKRIMAPDTAYEFFKQ